MVAQVHFRPPRAIHGHVTDVEVSRSQPQVYYSGVLDESGPGWRRECQGAGGQDSVLEGRAEWWKEGRTCKLEGRIR